MVAVFAVHRTLSPAPFCAQVNSSLLTSDCSQRCSCSSSTGLTCQAASCPPGRVCDVQAGVRDCWTPHGLCSLSVGANLTTFDGAHSAVSSPGVYEISFRCPGSQESIPWYRVVADVQPCKGKVEAVALVHIFFQDGLVTVTQNKGVWVSQDTRAVSPLGFVLPVAACLRSLWPMCPNVCFLHRSLQFVSLGLYLCQYFKLSPFLLAEFLRSKSTVK